MDCEILQVSGKSQIQELADMAREIWSEYYPGIITAEQTEYMIENFQSADAITRQISGGGYEYFMVMCGGETLGYFSFKAEDDRLFLSKLYLKKRFRGKGYFNAMLRFAGQAAANRKLNTLYLTVNKHNDDAIAVYIKKGFAAIKEQMTDIGCGYVMDDYVMELYLPNNI